MRGRGYGKAMRRAVLALAFGEMGAEMAISAAWHDNQASLGVSRALGYVANGESRHAREDRVDRMLHLRLMREDWLASGQAAGIRSTGSTPAARCSGWRNRRVNKCRRRPRRRRGSCSRATIRAARCSAEACPAWR